MPEHDDDPPQAEPIPAAPHPVPVAGVPEQIRQLAELLSDLHKMMGIVHANRSELLPGESQEEFDHAWIEASGQFKELTKSVLSDAEKRHEEYSEAQLVGAPGLLKRSLWRRSWDEFRSIFYSEPRTEELRRKAQRAGARAVDVTTAIVDSIPGSKPVVELLSATKHLLELRANRGF